MTGGTVVVLGKTGRNFAAGMCGGVAYVLRRGRRVRQALQHRRWSRSSRCSTEAEQDASVAPQRSGTTGETDEAHAQEADRGPPPLHRQRSARARSSTTGPSARTQFVKVFPNEYKRALGEMHAQARHSSGTIAKAQGRTGDASRSPAELSTTTTRTDTMGKVTGFMEYERLEEGYEPVAERVKHYREFVLAPDRRAGQGAGRALHGLRHAVLQQRLPGQQHHSGLQRPRVPQRLEERARRCCTRPTTSPSSPAASARRRARRPACSTSTTTRSASSRSSTRSSTRPGKKAGSRRSRPTRKTGKKVAVVGSGPAGLAARAAARARRPRRHGVREERPHRRPAALRHPRLQDGEVAHRPPHRADAGRRREVPHRRAGRRAAARGSKVTNWRQARPSRPKQLQAEFDAVRARRRRRAAARPAGARARARRRPFRDGVPAAAEQGRRRRQGARTRSAADRQARGRHRRRRHRLRLRRHLATATARRASPSSSCCRSRRSRRTSRWSGPTGRSSCAPRRQHEEGCERDFAIATKEFIGEKRQGQARLKTVRVEWKDGKMVEVPGTEIEMPRPTWCCWRWASSARCSQVLEEFGVEQGCARQRQGQHRWRRRLRDHRAEGVRRRRHAPRPVAGRLGDPRRPPGARARSTSS